MFRHGFCKMQKHTPKQIVLDPFVSTNMPCLQHGGIWQIDHFFTSLEKAASVSDGF